MIYGTLSFGYFLKKKLNSANYRGDLMRNNPLFRFIVVWFIFILILNVVEALINAFALGLSSY